MIKAYIFVAAITALIYPLIVGLILPGSTEIIYGDFLFGSLTTVGASLGSVLGLYAMRSLAQYAPPAARGFLIRFVGAELAALFSIYVLLVFLVWESGTWPSLSFGFWLAMNMPAFISSYIAYWVVSLLVKRVSSLP